MLRAVGLTTVGHLAFAWNGDTPPSLRSLRVHGRARWVGRAGHPEPGRLVGLVNLAGLAVLGVLW